MALCIYVYVCIKNYYVAFIHNDYTFPSTRYAHVIAELAAHLFRVLRNKKKLKDILMLQKQYRKNVKI